MTVHALSEPKCWTCCAEIGDHVVHADGDIFCSQGCALAAGCNETSECATALAGVEGKEGNG